MRRPQWWLAPLALAAIAGMAACSAGQPQQASENDDVRPSAVARNPVDAATSFDVSAAVTMPDGATATNTALDKTTAFINTENGVYVFDTSTADRLKTIADTPHKRDMKLWQGGKNYPAPLVAKISTGTVAVVPVPVIITGQGTTADTPAVDVLVIDTQTGNQKVVSVPVPARSVAAHLTRPIAVTGDDLIFTDDGRTYRVNLATGATVWRQDKFAAATLASGRLIGALAKDDHTEVTQAIDPATRTVIWTEEPTGSISLGMQPAGPNFIVVVGSRTYKIMRTVKRAELHWMQPFDLWISAWNYGDFDSDGWRLQGGATESVTGASMMR